MLKLLKPALVLFLTCLIVTALLAVTYAVTKDIIKEREEQRLLEARESVLSLAESFVEVDEESYSPEPLVASVYLGKDPEGNNIGAVVSVLPRGYGNEIMISVGVRSDGTIENISIVEHEETPGLGGKIEEEEFASQFRDLSSERELVVIKDQKDEDNEIEAISGATISSVAVTAGVNVAKRVSLDILEKAGDID